MSAPALYALVVLIWGSTWFAIKLQLGSVAEELSVAYRFGLASVCLFTWAAATGQLRRIAAADYLPVIAQGIAMYSVSYVLVYFGSAYIATGLVAVLYSSIVIFNGLLERVFYGAAMDRRLVLAAVVGLSGSALVFWPEVASLSLEDRVVLGVTWTLVSVLFASLGNMAAIRNTSRGVPILLINAHGMAWGAGASFLTALLLGRPLGFSLDPLYLGSLVYLAILGSCIAFGAFMALLKQIGAARASYVSVLFPIIALLISTWLEDFRWSLTALAGVFLILGGNWLALSRIPDRVQPEQKSRRRQ